MLRRSVDELGQTVVIVTHDPGRRRYAHRVVFLADGRIVDELREPTAERVLDRIKALRPRLSAMRTVAVRNLAAHKVRLALTIASVVLGTAFVAGSFVFTDTLKRSFDTIFQTSDKGIDAQVRPVHEGDPGVPTALVAKIRRRARRRDGRTARHRHRRAGRLARQEAAVERRTVRGRRVVGDGRSTRCRRSSAVTLPRAATRSS